MSEQDPATKGFVRGQAYWIAFFIVTQGLLLFMESRANRRFDTIDAALKKITPVEKPKEGP